MSNKKHSMKIIFLTFGILFGLIFGASAEIIIYLDDLEDCNVPSPNDGDVLTYNTSSSNWTAQTPTGGVSNISILNDLDDVNTSGVLLNDFIKYNGSGWNDFSLFNTVNTWLQNQTFNENITVLENVTANYYFGNGSQLTGLPSGGANALNDLTDVDTTGVQADDFIQYNGTGWNDFDLFNTANTWLQTNTFNVDVNVQNDLWVQKDMYLDSDSDKLYLGEIQSSELFYDGTDLVLTQGGGAIRTDLLIDSSGNIDMYRKSGCRVLLLSSQPIPPNAWRILSLNSKDYDIRNEWDNGLYRFTPLRNGLYQIDYSIYLQWECLGTFVQFGIFKNGVLSGGYQCMNIGTSSQFALSGADCLQLTTNDYIDLRVFHGVVGITTAPNRIYTNYIAINKVA